ncbi:hypothetical protein HYW44_00640 [Candidatus Daviesbacteria bacterium]|nr:hypothetical protein [Candidatus Daviesbacteria bacterium]
MKIHWFFKFLMISGVVFIVWLLFYYGLPKLLPVQSVKNTQVYGLIFGDQIWEGEIKVVGDIYSPTNSTVKILPGTRVRVAIKNDKSNFDLLPWHRKSGINTGESYRGVNKNEPFWDETQKIQINLSNLIILGVFSNPVTITSDSENPSPYDFNLIKIRKGNINQAIFSDYRRFEIGNDVVISNSIFRNTGECSLCLSFGSPKIINNVFEKSFRESVFVEKASPQINNNLFQNLNGEGIKIDAKRLSVPIITNNNFEMPRNTAIDFISGGQLQEGLIAKNVFDGNSLIKIACDAKVKIRDNVILGQISFSSGCDGSFVFGPNYWGTQDTTSIIKEKILNKHKTFSITIPTVLLSVPKEAGRK